MRQFMRFALVGLLNTGIHWGTFAATFPFTKNQGISNAISFCIAATFSYFCNAKFTFQAKPTGPRYCLFLAVMGLLSYGTGYFAQQANLHPLVTLILFTGISFVLGFLFSRSIIFTPEKTMRPGK